MHPIMSEIDLSVRHFERNMEHKAVQHRLLVKSVASELDRPGLGKRMVLAVWQFIDPRGFALAQYRTINQVRETPPTTEARPVVAVSHPIHVLPVTVTFDSIPDWRKAA